MKPTRLIETRIPLTHGHRRLAALDAVDATWDDGPAAGRWIADRLGPFGPIIGHAAPLGYPAYAVVPLPWSDDAGDDDAPLSAVEALLDILDPYGRRLRSWRTTMPAPIASAAPQNVGRSALRLLPWAKRSSRGASPMPGIDRRGRTAKSRSRRRAGSQTSQRADEAKHRRMSGCP